MEYVIHKEGNEDYLEHYGIKGQKWGVRRFENADGALTEEGKKRYGLSNGGAGNAKLEKKYEKSVKKLNKLREQTDQLGQAKKALEYDKKAKTASRIGKVAAAIAVRGFGVGQLTEKNNNEYLLDALAGSANRSAQDARSLKYIRESGKHYPQYSDALARAIGFNEANNRLAVNAALALPVGKDAARINPIANAVAIGGGLTAVTAFGKSAYDRVKSNAARRRVSDAGHAKAVAKYKQHADKMLKMFGDTKYEELVKKQIGISEGR